MSLGAPRVIPSVLLIALALASAGFAPARGAEFIVGHGDQHGNAGRRSGRHLILRQASPAQSDIGCPPRRCCRPDRFKARFVPSRSIRPPSVL